MRYHEFKESQNSKTRITLKSFLGSRYEGIHDYNQAGLVLFHATSDKKSIKSILEKGLKPKSNQHENHKVIEAMSWADRHHDADLKREIEQYLKLIKPELFCATSMESALSWRQGAVFKFTTNNSDKLRKAKFSDDEVIVLNKITPDRLEMVYLDSKIKL